MFSLAREQWWFSRGGMTMSLEHHMHIFITTLCVHSSTDSLGANVTRFYLDVATLHLEVKLQPFLLGGTRLERCRRQVESDGH